jgi:predicted metal-dependent phosphoesterase TrpH
MAIHTDAVLLYGVPLPPSHDAYGPAGEELLSAILEHHPAVKATTTGYNHDRQWLYTQYHNAGRDGHVRINEYVPADQDVALMAAMRELELPAGEPHDPAWHLIADEG